MSKPVGERVVPEVKTEVQTEEQEHIVKLFAELRQFEVLLPDGTKRMAEIRTATTDEMQGAEAHQMYIFKERVEGYTDPITGIIRKSPTRDNMIEYAKEKGMWSEADDIQLTSLDTQIATKVNKIMLGGISMEEAHRLSVEIYHHRKEIAPYYERRWAIYRLTANFAGEQAYHSYLCVATAQWLDTSERIFADIESFQKDDLVGNQVLKHYMDVMETSSDYVNPLTPELEFFRDYNFMDKKGNIYDFNKKEVIMNIFGPAKFAGFTDADGNVVQPTGIIEDTQDGG